MPLKKILIRILAAVAILATAAIALLWLGPRTAYARQAASNWMTQATGLPATVESLRIGYFPRPVLEFDGLALAQPAGFGADPLIEVGNARVAVPWATLFGGSAVDTIALVDATLRPALAADGADNWTGVIDRLAALGGEGPAAWSIQRLDVERGALEFHDAATGSRWRLTAITIAAEGLAPRAEFPVELRLAGVADAHTFHLSLNGRGRIDPDGGQYEAHTLGFRGWAGGEPLPLAGVEFAGALQRASFERATGRTALERGSFNLAGIPGEFAGALTTDEGGMQIEFSVKTDSFAPRAPAIVFGYPLPATADPQAFQSLQLSVAGRTQDDHLTLDPIEGRLDDTQFEGRAIPAERLIRARLDRIDLNRYLAPEQKKAREKKATLEAAVAQLAGYDIDAEIRVDEARVAGATLRDAVIRVERDTGAP
jgi:uncharacterized protein involved in outer membrane biogenesis